MPYPNFPGKHVGVPLMTPARFLEYAREKGRLIDFAAPRGVLLIYRRSLMARLVEQHAAERVVQFGQYALWSLPRTDGLVALSGDFGIGGPIVSVIVEELAACTGRCRRSCPPADFVAPNLNEQLELVAEVGIEAIRFGADRSSMR